jgi:hypothetical protein
MAVQVRRSPSGALMHTTHLAPRSCPEWVRESDCREEGGHARHSPVRHLSCAPSERGLGRGEVSSPKPRACSFLAAPWAESCGPLAHDALDCFTRSHSTASGGGCVTLGLHPRTKMGALLGCSRYSNHAIDCQLPCLSRPKLNLVLYAIGAGSLLSPASPGSSVASYAQSPANPGTRPHPQQSEPFIQYSAVLA